MSILQPTFYQLQINLYEYFWNTNFFFFLSLFQTIVFEILIHFIETRFLFRIINIDWIKLGIFGRSLFPTSRSFTMIWYNVNCMGYWNDTCYLQVFQQKLIISLFFFFFYDWFKFFFHLHLFVLLNLILYLYYLSSDIFLLITEKSSATNNIFIRIVIKKKKKQK